MSYPSFKQVLKHVRKALVEDKYPSQYICINIEYVLEDIYNINWESVLVKRYQHKVEEQLGELVNSYEKWMRKNHPEYYMKMSHYDFRQGRIQWIDHMLTRKDL